MGTIIFYKIKMQKKKTNPKTHKKTTHQNNKTWSMKDHDKELGYQKRAVLDKLCQHCYDTIKWKLDYGKYKPITTPGKCNKCLQKTIFKSYRTICDKCASEKKLCTKCGKSASDYAEMTEKMQERIKVDTKAQDDYMSELREASRRKINRLNEQGLIYWSLAKGKFLYDEDDTPV